jgi:CRP-like cAMP-binding protein
MDVYGRVAKLLLDFSEEERGQRVIRRRLTKQDIAKMIGASREMVSRVMKDLENQATSASRKAASSSWKSASLLPLASVRPRQS